MVSRNQTLEKALATGNSNYKQVEGSEGDPVQLASKLLDCCCEQQGSNGRHQWGREATVLANITKGYRLFGNRGKMSAIEV